MKTWLSLLLLVAGCASAEPAAKPTPQPGDCISECKRRNMARAVSAEQIQRDCENECSTR